MFRIRDGIMRNQKKTAALLLAGTLAAPALSPLSVLAAPVSGEGSIQMEEEVLSLGLGETKSAKVEYALAGGFAEKAAAAMETGAELIVYGRAYGGSRHRRGGADR